MRLPLIGLVLALLCFSLSIAAAPAPRRAAARPALSGVAAARAYRVTLRAALRDPARRSAAARYLGLLGDAEGRQVLQTLLRQNPQDDFTLAGLVALGDAVAQTRALARVADWPPGVVLTVAFGFPDGLAPAWVARLEALWKDEPDPLVQVWAAAALVRARQLAPVAFLRGVLAGRDPLTRTVAAAALWEGPAEPAARAVLIAALGGADPAARDVAAQALGARLAAEARRPLEVAYRAERAAAARVHLAWALAREAAAPPAAVAPLPAAPGAAGPATGSRMP